MRDTAEGLRSIHRALLSVSDKTGLVEFARELRRFDVKLISTGGTAKALRDAGIEVSEVSDVTGFPEMLDGRVKTLHPRIHGGLLALRDNHEHTAALGEHAIEPIDLVVVNLYPFEETVAQSGVTLEEAVEQIDIGGPAMIRSAAKNWRDVAVVVSPAAYTQLAEELQRNEGALSLATRSRLAQQAFQRTASYDKAVSAYLNAQQLEESVERTLQVQNISGGVTAETQPHPSFADTLVFTLNKATDLRYGENPHQMAALYHTHNTGEEGGVAAAAVISGKEMSFNNYVDADAAWQLVGDFAETACAIIKHTNPAGAGLGASPVEAYRRALATDPVSAFGGVVAFNRLVDAEAAQAVTEIFTEVIIAPAFDQAAIEILQAKKNLRIVRVDAPCQTDDRHLSYDLKKISGGVLIQTLDDQRLTANALRVRTKRAPTDEEQAALLFAWAVCKHTKSNAIVYARLGQVVGVGAGQMSRVDAVRIGAMRAQLPLENSVLASDAFFPFRDGVDAAAQHGVAAIIQPGGSVRDEEVVAAANEHNIAMVFTGIRHFKH